MNRLDRPKETPEEYRERKAKVSLKHEHKLPQERIDELLTKTKIKFQTSYQRALEQHKRELKEREEMLDYGRRTGYYPLGTPEREAEDKRLSAEFEEARRQEKLRHEEYNRKYEEEQARKRGYAEMDTGYDSGTGSESERESAEERRVRAMQPKKVEEKVAQQVVADRVDDATELMRQMAIGKGGIDKSDIFAKKVENHNAPVLEGGSTGMSQHLQYGEKHHKATLNDELAQKIRREYWSGGLKKPGQRREGSTTSLAEKYGVSKPAISSMLQRKTWVHLPQVEGEPDENMQRLSVNEKRVTERAKELGVELVRNKIGRLALPEEVVLKLRSEGIKKAHASGKKVKPELTEEQKAENRRIGTEKRRATMKAKKEKKLAEKE